MSQLQAAANVKSGGDHFEDETVVEEGSQDITEKKEKVASAAAAAAAATASSSTTQMIDSLHTKVDALTNTNLQLTTQSQSILEKLDVAQKKEMKLAENIALYKHQRSNLDAMLQRKVRKLEEMEEELQSLQMTLGSVKTVNKNLQDELDRLDLAKSEELETIDSLNQEYDAALETQQSYKTHFEDQIARLNEKLGGIRTNFKKRMLDKVKSNDHSQKYKMILERLDSNNESSGRNPNAQVDSLVDDQCRQAIKELDLESWLILYKMSEKFVMDYAKQNLVDLLKLPDGRNPLDNKRAVQDIHELEQIIQQDHEDSHIIIRKRGQSAVRNSSNSSSPSLISSYSSPLVSSAASSRAPSGSNNPSRRSVFTFHKSSPSSAAPLPGVKRSVSTSIHPSSASNVTDISIKQKSVSSSIEQRRKRNSVIYN